jgi:hypothetical protein
MRTIPVETAHHIIGMLRDDAAARPDPDHPEEVAVRDLQMWDLELRL